MSEQERVLSIVKSMTYLELWRFVDYDSRGRRRQRYSEIAKYLNISATGKTRTVQAIYKALQTPIVIPEPEPIPESVPPTDQVPCDGCGGISAAEGLRWRKAANGQPVTVSIDQRNKPASLSWLTPQIIMSEWFQPWSKDSSIRFRYVLGKGDCHIQFDAIDGVGKTLGFVWQPAGNVEFMESAGDLSGDMTIDTAERWSDRNFMHNTGEHEAGHVIGLQHSSNPRDVMYGFATSGGRKVQSANDIREKQKRYPIAA